MHRVNSSTRRHGAPSRVRAHFAVNGVAYYLTEDIIRNLIFCTKYIDSITFFLNAQFFGALPLFLCDIYRLLQRTPARMLLQKLQIAQKNYGRRITDCHEIC